MLSLRLSSVAEAIVHSELIRKGREKEALYLNFDLRMSLHDKGGDYNQSRGLHLLYHLMPGGGVVNVFSAVTPSPFGKLTDIPQWSHDCSHDSCWRDIPVFNKVYFEMAEHINQIRELDGREPVAPKDMHEWHNIRELYRWVPAIITKDPTDPHSYRKLVTL